jgi:predicted AAA+ superfamily ATPase
VAKFAPYDKIRDENPEAYAALRKMTDIPFAIGEEFSSKWQFLPYIERDLRQLINVRDLAAFQRFLRMCAARTGQMLNLSALAADCGITHNTAKSWISILEASYLVVLLPPWHRNLGKRLVKTPKLYFLDTGLAAWLAGVRNPTDLELGGMRGALIHQTSVQPCLAQSLVLLARQHRQ